MRILPYIILLFPCFMAMGQQGILRGIVSSEGKPLEFAKLSLKELRSRIISKANGSFEFNHIPSGDYTLVTSCLGYTNDTLKFTLLNHEIKTIHLQLVESQTQKEEVVVTGTLKETYISKSTVAIEIITPKLFEKNPSSNIFESLNMVNGVRPQIQCNVCNCGDIHINGMEGPYTMVMIDGMPLVSALGSVYGLMGIPNSIIQRIEVLKGPASTLYGSEAVGGLINIITKSVASAPLFSLDVFGTSYQELNSDLSVKYKLGSRLTGLFSGNYYHFDKKWDINHDNFTDVTIQKRLAGFNKFSFQHKSGNFSSLAVRYYHEDRWGGELQWNEHFRGGDSIYGESIYTRRMEIIGSSPLDFLGKNVKFMYSLNRHNQNSAYGQTPFLADQIIGFGQLTKSVVLQKHDLMLGLALRYVYYDDNTVITAKEMPDGSTANLPTITYLPGVFVQDEITLNDQNTLLVGMRYDYNSHHGNICSPRINWKHSLNAFNTLRFGIGNGYRIVNLFSEDHAAFNGARKVVITENLKPERSWNANLNYGFIKCMGNHSINVDANVFYTYFGNKIVADYFTDPTKVIFNNLQGYGINRGGGVQAHLTFRMPLKISLGFTYTDIYLHEQDSLGQEKSYRQVQTPPFTSNFVIGYKFTKAKISLDLTGNITSPMLLPVLPNDFRPDHSPWFCLMNLQLTHEIKNDWQVYFGIKNLLNFIPKYPIMRPNDPFNKQLNDPVNNPNGYTFDPSYNYAPIQRIRGFFGVRYKLSK